MCALGLLFSHSEYACALHALQLPQAIGKGTTTRSPTSRFCTPLPTSTTSPMNSWPMMSPGSIIGRKPLYRCRSDPQIAVDVTFTIASRLLRICGSGTSRTCIFCGPIQHVAFILPPPSWLRLPAARKIRKWSELDRLVVGLRRMHPALLRRVGEQDLAGLHHLLEVAQVVHHLLTRLLAEEHCDLGAELAEWRLVLQLDAYLSATSAGCRLEAHASGVIDV